MFLKVSKIKASTLCASSALLVLGGFMSLNLAGCGGGGGKTNGSGGFGPTPVATPASQTLSFVLQRQDGQVSAGGNLTLTPGAGTVSGVLTAKANTSGVATIPNVPPGTYTATFNVVTGGGVSLSTTSTTIMVTRNPNQTFLLLQDQPMGTTTGGFAVSGTVRFNPGATATATATNTPTATPVPPPTNTPGPPPVATPLPTEVPTATPTSTPSPFVPPLDPLTVSNCFATSRPVVDAILIEVIDLDSTKGRPIIAQLRRTATEATQGVYTISLPYKPVAFQVRVGQFDVNSSPFAGLSAISNFNGAVSVLGVPTVNNLDVCVNRGTIAPFFPRATATATPTVTPVPVATKVPGP